MLPKLVPYIQTSYFGLLIGAGLIAPLGMSIAQTGEYGRVTLVNGTNITLVLNVKQLRSHAIIASCHAAPNSTCTTGAIPTALLDLEALDAEDRKRFAYKISLVSGENFWTIGRQRSKREL